MFQVLIGAGHELNAIKFNYTISQVYLFFEKIKKIDLDRNQMDAVILSNCMMYTTPSGDATEARNKTRDFQKFMDSLNWKTFVKKAEEKIVPRTAENTLKRFFGGTAAGIRVRDKSKE